MASREKMIKLLLVMVCVTFCAAGKVGAVDWYVDDDGPGDPWPGDPAVSDPLEDGSINHPFDEIQEAIDAATGGDKIIVQLGIYYENIKFKGKNIILTSTDPEDWLAATGTVISG